VTEQRGARGARLLSVTRAAITASNEKTAAIRRKYCTADPHTGGNSAAYGPTAAQRDAFWLVSVKGGVTASLRRRTSGRLHPHHYPGIVWMWMFGAAVPSLCHSLEYRASFILSLPVLKCVIIHILNSSHTLSMLSQMLHWRKKEVIHPEHCDMADASLAAAVCRLFVHLSSPHPPAQSVLKHYAHHCTDVLTSTLQPRRCHSSFSRTVCSSRSFCSFYFASYPCTSGARRPSQQHCPTVKSLPLTPTRSCCTYIN
jgi:hypothetical protein